MGLSAEARRTVVVALTGAAVLGATIAAVLIVDRPDDAAAPAAGAATTVPGTAVSTTDEPVTTPGPTTTPSPTTEPPASEPPATEPPATTLPGVLPAPPDVPRPPVDQLAGVAVRLEPLLNIRNLTDMEWSVLANAYYAVTQDGFVHRIPEDLSTSELVLDLSAEVTELLTGSERGLLGVTFHPADGRVVLHFTDRANNSHVVSMAMVDGRPDPGTRRLILYLEQPGLGHQGGAMQFDAEGHLYIALGDGGGSRGRDAQDYTKLFGAILRVLPSLDGDGYTIPPDNPYASDPERRGEIWVKGLRNPWKFSINPANGDMWIGDVGESAWEEVNVVPAGTSGQNFGWYWFEGSQHRGIGGIPDGLELTPPVYEYGRALGVAVIGGMVYHGTAIPQLTGAYVFADMTGPMFALGEGGGVRLGINSTGIATGFVSTPDGELLLTTLRNGLFRLAPA